MIRKIIYWYVFLFIFNVSFTKLGYPEYVPYITLIFLIIPFLPFCGVIIKSFWEYMFKKVPKQKALTETDDDIMLEFTDNTKLQLLNPYRGVFIMGSNGSGKSESIAYPLLYKAIQKNFCGIVYDYKFPQLSQIAYQSYKDNSINSIHRLKIINCDDPRYSHKCNPIAPRYLKNTSYTREYASSIINNLIKESIQKSDFWIRSSTDLLTACIWYLKEEHPNLCDLPHLMALITSDYKKVLNALETNIICRQMIVSILSANEQNATGQLAGVIGTLQSAISQINTPEICYVMSKDEVNLNINDIEEYRTVCLANKPALSTTFAPVYSLIISVALKQMNEPKKQKSFIMLDEAPTLFIPKFDEVPNTARSNKIATIYMCQDFSQMEDMYGRVKADVIFGALNNHFYGRLASAKTAEMISKQFGKYDRTFETTSHTEGTTQGTSLAPGKFFSSKSNQKSSSVSKNQSIQERNVIPAEEFLLYETGQFSGIFVNSNFNRINRKTLRYYPQFSETSIDYSSILEVDNSDIMDYYIKVRKNINNILNLPS